MADENQTNEVNTEPKEAAKAADAPEHGGSAGGSGR